MRTAKLPCRHEIGVHRRRNVLHHPRADVDKSHRQLSLHLLMHRARNADAADFGQAFEACGDVDTIAKEIALAHNHVADANADAVEHLPAVRISEVPRAHAFLDIDGAAYRVDGARELGKNCIAGGIENAAAGYRDEVVSSGSTRHHSPQRLFFIIGDQPAVLGDVGHQNSGDLAFHRMNYPKETGRSRPSHVGTTEQSRGVQPSRKHVNPAVEPISPSSGPQRPDHAWRARQALRSRQGKLIDQQSSSSRAIISPRPMTTSPPACA